MDYARRLLIDALAVAEDELDGYETTLSNMRATAPAYQIVQIRHRTKSAEVEDLTQALAALEPKETEPTNYTRFRFKRGDYIEVTAKREQDDFGTVRGTALDDRGHFGYSVFGVMLSDNNVLTYNLNAVNVKLLHSADIARGVDVVGAD